MSIRRLTLIAVFTSLAIALHIAEGLLPVPIATPGVKIGFANIITLTALHFLSLRDTFLVVALRCILSSLFGGAFLALAFYMSFCGGMVSVALMAPAKKAAGRKGHFSLIGVSLLGAIGHNITQLIVASALMSLSVFYYLPVMLISSIPTGIIIGILSAILIPRLEQAIPPERRIYD